MKITLEVTPNEGNPYRVTTNLHTIIATERKFKVRASEFANGIGLEHLAYMAYEASKSAGIAVPMVFDDFVARTAEVEIVEGDTSRPISAGQ